MSRPAPPRALPLCGWPSRGAPVPLARSLARRFGTASCAGPCFLLQTPWAPRDSNLEQLHWLFVLVLAADVETAAKPSTGTGLREPISCGAVHHNPAPRCSQCQAKPRGSSSTPSTHSLISATSSRFDRSSSALVRRANHHSTTAVHQL